MRDVKASEGREYWRKAMKRLWLLGALAAIGTACTAPNFETNNRADVILRITSIGGGTANSAFLLSDVLTCTAVDHAQCSVIDDSATVSVDVQPKNPLTTVSLFDDVYLNSYKVEYLRSDGRNVEGVDVPFAIS